MFCPKCGNPNSERTKFCRKCGDDLEVLVAARVNTSFSKNVPGMGIETLNSNDPDELTARGICEVIIGDGFFMVALILSATHSSVSSLLWLLLLIPAFFLFGKGFADVLRAKQIRRRLKNEAQLLSSNLEPASALNPGFNIGRHTSSGLQPIPSVTEGTTHNLS